MKPTNFKKLFDKIVIESKKFNKKYSIIKEDEDDDMPSNTDNIIMDSDDESEDSSELSEEQKKANFEAIVEKVKEAFDEYGVDCDEYEDEDEDGITINAEWRWTNKNGIDDYLGLSYSNGEATEDNNGGTGDLDLDDVEGTAKYLIDEYLFNPEYGGIGLEDRTLDEVVPELLEKWQEDEDYSDIDWDNIDLDEVADEWIDENYDASFETEEDIADALEDYLRENYSKDEDDED